MENNIEYLKNKYESLLDKEYKYDLIDEVKSFKDYSFNVGNMQYYFLSDCLIADIYIEHQNLDEALKLLLNSYKTINKSELKSVFINILDRILYIYISKNNYKLAYTYANEKYQYIDKEDINLVNRWKLEMSYIYASLNDLKESERCLLEILDSNSFSDKAYLLSNLTKIYIDLKDVNKAQIYLNECLKITNDKEGTVYCNYLLAKLCILKGEYLEALSLFKDIFDNEDINQMTLPIVIEYLSLLYDNNKIDDMGLVIKKIALFINACNDLRIKRSFVELKIKYLIKIKEINEILNTMKEYEEIQKEIEKNEKAIILDQMEADMQKEVDDNVLDTFKYIDKITKMFASFDINMSLRDLMINYNKSLNSIIKFDEACFALFNKTSNLDYLQSDNVIIMNYKNTRLYEKKLSFSALSKTMCEQIINLGKELEIDYQVEKDSSNYKDLVNVFSNKTYFDEMVKYVYAIPLIYNNDIFACLIYTSKKENINTFNNKVLFNIASKLLEQSLTSLFLSDNMNILADMLDNVVKRNDINLVKIANDTVYVSDNLKDTLELKKNYLSYESFKKLIAPSYLKEYEEECNLSKAYTYEFKINLKDKSLNVISDMSPYFDSSNNLIFSYGTLKVLNEERKAFILGEKELKDRIESLKNKAKDIDFKFSYIRVQGTFKDYSLLYNVFGIAPYYDNDSYVVILENEVNQKTIDKYLSRLNLDASVIRYPRDLININEIEKISPICLKHHYKYFNDEIYKIYIKQTNINKVALSYIDKDLPIKLLSYKAYDGGSMLYAYNTIPNDNIDIRPYLDDELQSIFDIKLYQSLVNKNFIQRTIVKVSNNTIKKMIDNNLFATYLDNVYILVYESTYDLNEILDKLHELKINVIIDINILNKVSAYALSLNNVTSVYIQNTKEVFKEYTYREKCLNICKIFSLELISPYKFNDYYKNTYIEDIVLRDLK